jgi:hypothetical protein
VLGRLEYWLRRGDDEMAAMVGAVPPIYMAHPNAVDLADDPEWRTLLAIWRELRSRVQPCPPQSIDYAEFLASTYLRESIVLAAENAA